MSFPFLFENASFEINLEAVYMGIPGRYFTIEPGSRTAANPTLWCTRAEGS
jgi:hypothetical protein